MGPAELVEQVILRPEFSGTESPQGPRSQLVLESLSQGFRLPLLNEDSDSIICGTPQLTRHV